MSLDIDELLKDKKNREIINRVFKPQSNGRIDVDFDAFFKEVGGGVRKFIKDGHDIGKDYFEKKPNR